MILLAEDDENDAFIFRIALAKAGVLNPLTCVPDGADAMDYLGGVGRYADRTTYPLPGLVVTDLKMPRCTGFELLAWMENRRSPNSPPVVVLSASIELSDRERALKLGAVGYFQKPAGLADMVRLAHELNDTWLASFTPPT